MADRYTIDVNFILQKPNGQFGKRKPMGLQEDCSGKKKTVDKVKKPSVRKTG